MIRRDNTGNGLLAAAGRACYRHRVRTLAAWIVLVAALVTLWTRFGAAADNAFTGTDPGQTLLSRHFPRQSGDMLTLAIRADPPVTAPAVEDRVRPVLAAYARAADVTGVTDPYTTPGHVSPNRHIAYATVQFSVQGSAIPGSEVTALMNVASKSSGEGVTFSLGGDVVDQAETPYGGPSNGIGIGAAMLVLLAAFGSLLAMGLPVATALFGIGSGLSLIALLGHVLPAPSFSPIIAAMIGLGVGVDYAMFILTRFRTELADGMLAEEAAVAAMRTAGTSVLTAGTTVVIGMLGLLILRQQLLNGVAIAAAATVTMTVLAALTLLPALLGFTGTRLAGPTLLSRLRRRRREAGNGGDATARSGKTGRPGAWERWAGVIARHRIAAALASAAFILLLASPALAMKLSMPDESAQARGTMGYASYAAMAKGFGPGFDAPLIVVTRRAGQVTAIATRLAATPGIARITPPVISQDGGAAMLVAYPATGAQDAATNALANRIQHTELPAGAYLTGPNAANVTFANLIGQRLPVLVATVIIASMALLLVVFRSAVIPVKAALMNLLSVTAAYGVLTAVTQWGWGGRFLGFPERMPVTTWVPVFLFVILFGLSMDYEVFLLSRIREAYLESGDNTRAVGRGLASTGRVISAAAAIMIVVFCSFLATPDVSVKQIGLGLAVAVLIDATVVRLVLVPALMELLGTANWWLPKRFTRGRASVRPHPVTSLLGRRQPQELARYVGLGAEITAVYSQTMLDVTRLRVLVAVARHGSVTAAAHALNYAQPSVSHHLARLEAETGTKLVQRAGRGIRLTDAGRLLAERAAEVIGRLDAAENELAAYTGLRAGRLRLAAFPSALGTIVPAAAATLQDKHPSVDLRLTEAEPPEALRMLRAGYVDVALVFRHDPEYADGDPAPNDSDLREQVLFDEPVHVIAPAEPPADGEPLPPAAVTEMWPADLARFAARRWIAGCDRCREHLLQQCAAAGFTPKVAFTTDDFVAVQALVSAGLGLALLPDLALRAARNAGVRTVRLRGTRRTIVAVRYGEPPDPPATATLLEVLRATAEA